MLHNLILISYDLLMSERTKRREFLQRGAAFMAVPLLGREFAGNLVIVHGYNGDPNGEMYTALGQTMQTWFNYQAIIPDLPLSNKENASGNPNKLMDPESASRNIAELIKQSTKPTILVGHSLGVNIALYTLSQFEVSVDAAVLVSGRYQTPTGDSELDRCYNRTLRPQLIQDHIRVRELFLAVHSEEDPVVKPGKQNLENLTNTFGAQPLLTKGHGHFDKAEDAAFLVEVLQNRILPQISR